MKKRLAFWLLLLGNPAWGQPTSTDSSWVSTTARGMRQQYAAALRSESRLYTGPEYVSRLPAYLSGHPFFESSEAQPATIEYGGATYAGVPLRYDLMRDVLVLKAPQAGLDLELLSDNVPRFTVDGHCFVRVVAAANTDSPLRTGFYELLVDGPVKLLAARRKSMQQRSTSEGMVGEITQQNELFIYKDTRYYPANNASQVLRLFPEHKRVLRDYIKTEGLSFRGIRREEDLTALVRYQALLPAPTK